MELEGLGQRVDQPDLEKALQAALKVLKQVARREQPVTAQHVDSPCARVCTRCIAKEEKARNIQGKERSQTIALQMYPAEFPKRFAEAQKKKEERGARKGSASTLDARLDVRVKRVALQGGDDGRWR